MTGTVLQVNGGSLLSSGAFDGAAHTGSAGAHGGTDPMSEQSVVPSSSTPVSSTPVSSTPGRDLGSVEAIETVRWKAQPNLLWARLHTSTGVVGLGETYYLRGGGKRDPRPRRRPSHRGAGGVDLEAVDDLFFLYQLLRFCRGGDARPFRPRHGVVGRPRSSHRAPGPPAPRGAPAAARSRLTTPVSTPGPTGTGSAPSTNRRTWPRSSATSAMWG